VVYKLIFPERYLKRARQFLKKHPALLKQYQKTIELLELNPQHPSLRLHALDGRFKGLSSVSVNMSYRILLEIIIKKNEIIFVDIGSHEQVY